MNQIGPFKSSVRVKLIDVLDDVIDNDKSSTKSGSYRKG